MLKWLPEEFQIPRRRRPWRKEVISLRAPSEVAFVKIKTQARVDMYLVTLNLLGTPYRAGRKSIDTYLHSMMASEEDKSYADHSCLPGMSRIAGFHCHLPRLLYASGQGRMRACRLQVATDEVGKPLHRWRLS